MCLKENEACNYFVPDIVAGEEYKHCYAECPENTFIYDHLCVAACPLDHPAHKAGDRICKTCKAINGEKSTKIYWEVDTCVDKCSEGNTIQIAADVCLPKCLGNNERVVDGKCVCTADAALSGTVCVIPDPESKDCKRRVDIDGVMTCIKNDRCNDYKRGYKLEDDNSYTCVASCESEKYEEDENTMELRCVDDCAHWWYRTEDDGRCKEQKWKKNTAIAVPVVVIIIIIVAVVFVAVKKCGKEKHSEG